MHLRVGDKAFTHAGWSKSPWLFSFDSRPSPFYESPKAAFECLARLSRSAADLTRANERGAAPAQCMSCVVVSDSVEVEQCARRTLTAPIVTPGLAVHLAASAGELASEQLNVQRIFLDWFLIAQSHATLLLTAASSFSDTAFRYKAASAP